MGSSRNAGNLLKSFQQTTSVMGAVRYPIPGFILGGRGGHLPPLALACPP